MCVTLLLLGCGVAFVLLPSSSPGLLSPPPPAPLLLLSLSLFLFLSSLKTRTPSRAHTCTHHTLTHTHTTPQIHTHTPHPRSHTYNTHTTHLTHSHNTNTQTHTVPRLWRRVPGVPRLSRHLPDRPLLLLLPPPVPSGCQWRRRSRPLGPGTQPAAPPCPASGLGRHRPSLSSPVPATRLQARGHAKPDAGPGREGSGVRCHRGRVCRCRCGCNGGLAGHCARARWEGEGLGRGRGRGRGCWRPVSLLSPWRRRLGHRVRLLLL